LAIRGDIRGLRYGLALRVQIPGVVAADQLSSALLALDRNSAAAAGRVIPLNANIVYFQGLAAEVSRERPALQVRAWEIALGELLPGDPIQPVEVAVKDFTVLAPVALSAACKIALAAA
jgi:hypothetical protein